MFDLFDLDKDRKLNLGEQALKFNTIFSHSDEEDGDMELIDAGLDPEELEYMSADERREALEDAGLDPDDFDF